MNTQKGTPGTQGSSHAGGQLYRILRQLRALVITEDTWNTTRFFLGGETFGRMARASCVRCR